MPPDPETIGIDRNPFKEHPDQLSSHSSTEPFSFKLPYKETIPLKKKMAAPVVKSGKLRNRFLFFEEQTRINATQVFMDSEPSFPKKNPKFRVSAVNR